MKNHDEKFRDMSRSALPSKARRSAREDKRILKRRVRTMNRQTLRDWADYTNAYDFDGHVYDSNGVTPVTGWDNHIRQIVRSRRDADKLSVVRWARRLCQTKFKHLDEDERYNKFKELMPDTTAGRHILGHIGYECWPNLDRRLDGFGFFQRLEEVPVDEFGCRLHHPRKKYSAEERWASEDDELKIKLYLIATIAGEQRRFNDKIKRTWENKHERRVRVVNDKPDLLYNYRYPKSRYAYVTESYTCDYCTDVPRTFKGIGDIYSWLYFAHKAGRHNLIGTLRSFKFIGE